MKKLQEARVKLQKSMLKKSGRNDYQKYMYFELKDFLPTVNEIFEELGLYSHFNLYKDIAKLTVTDLETNDKLQFSIPTEVIQNSNMQKIGSINTYAKRYLYMNALEIAENDSIDTQEHSKMQSGTTTTIQTKKAPQSRPKLNKYSKEELISNLKGIDNFAVVEGWMTNNGYKALEDVEVEKLEGLWNHYLENTKK